MPGYQGPLDDHLDKTPSSPITKTTRPGLIGVPNRDDAEIRGKILKKLYGHPEVDSKHIQVDVLEGFVILRGKVESLDTKAQVEALVSTIPEVLDIVNELKLDVSSDVGKSLSGHDDFRLSPRDEEEDEP